jgi:hypothetical protein
MHFDAPFRLGPFSVDAEGRLSPRKPSSSPAFVFRCAGRIVRARLDPANAAAWHLTLQVTLARVCSSASTSDGTLRPRSFALLRWLERAAPTSWRVVLLADHHVQLETERRIDLPITAAALIGELTSFALDLAPYLALMDDIGLTVPDHGAA